MRIFAVEFVLIITLILINWLCNIGSLVVMIKMRLVIDVSVMAVIIGGIMRIRVRVA